jgi:hypothetical protein
MTAAMAQDMSRPRAEDKTVLSLTTAERPKNGHHFRRNWLHMKIDEKKIDEAVLALLFLTLHDDCRAWKGHDWDAMDRLHAKGYISSPVGKAKSVIFTEEGLRESERLFRHLFARE